MRTRVVALSILIVLAGMAAAAFLTQPRSDESRPAVNMDADPEGRDPGAQYETPSAVPPGDEGPEAMPPVPAMVPAGWSTYQNSAWGIAFAYPPGWKIEERNTDGGTGDELWGIILTGNEYRLIVFLLEHGIEKEGVTYRTLKYTISGHEVAAWEDDSGDGFWLVAIMKPHMCQGNFNAFSAESKTKTEKQIINRIFETVKCT